MTHDGQTRQIRSLKPTRFFYKIIEKIPSVDSRSKYSIAPFQCGSTLKQKTVTVNIKKLYKMISCLINKKCLSELGSIKISMLCLRVNIILTCFWYANI